MSKVVIERAMIEQVLEALEYNRLDVGKFNRINAACQALRAALAQQDEPVQEPVAWQCREHGDSEWFDCGKESYGINPRRYTYRTLYTAAPPPPPPPPVLVSFHYIRSPAKVKLTSTNFLFQ